MWISRGAAVFLQLAVLLLQAGLTYAGNLPERPRLEDYREYTHFLQAMTAYRKAIRNTVIQPPLTMTGQATVSPTLQELSSSSSEMNDPLSESYPAPLNITGPEDLAEAVEKAKSFIHPRYTAKLRYHRTTSFSFPLANAGNELLEKSAVGTLWLDAAGFSDASLLDNLLYGDEMLSAERAGTSHERWSDLATLAVPDDFSMLSGSAAFMHPGTADVMIESVSR